MADKEHPASKAGRYVRAAGLVIGKEIDRRAEAAAAKPAPVAPPPPPPPPPAPATQSIGGKLLFGLFVLSVVLLGLVILHVDDALPNSANRIGRLVLAGLMFVEAGLLISNWQQSNERIGQRMLTKMWGHRGARTRRERFVARAVRDVLTLLGIAFLTVGVFELLVVTVGYQR